MFCLCSETASSKAWTKKFIGKLNTDGFNNISSNIDFLPGQTYTSILQKHLQGTSKLLIVLFPSLDHKFMSLIDNVVSFIMENDLLVDIIPVRTSRKVDIPLCLSSLIPFNAHIENRDQLCKSLNNVTTRNRDRNGPGVPIQVKVKELNLRIVKMEEELRQREQVSMAVLRGWGLDISSDRISFHLKTLLRIGNTQPICILSVFDSLSHRKQFKYIKICDIKGFDLEKTKITNQLYVDLMDIFETLRRRNVCRDSGYHYRRNGIRHTRSEDMLNPFKRGLQAGVNILCFPKFKTFQSRLNTFENFPIKNEEFHIKLSRAGFFNLHASDYVQCYSCGGCIRSWSSEADPLVAHKKHYQHCTFILSKNVAVLSGHSKKTCHEDLMTIEGRVHSFKQIKKAETSNCIDDDVINRFAEAGFYYCGIAEDVICHSCNLGLANIRDCIEPMKLHRKLSPDCSFLRNLTDNAVESEADTQYEIDPYLEIEIIKHTNI